MGGLDVLEGLKSRSSSPCTTVLQAAMMVPELSIFVSTTQVLALPPARQPGLFAPSPASCPEISARNLKHTAVLPFLSLPCLRFQVVFRHCRLMHCYDATLPKLAARMWAVLFGTVGFCCCCCYHTPLAPPPPRPHLVSSGTSPKPKPDVICPALTHAK